MTRKFERLSDEALVQNTKQEVARERETTIVIIEYLEEIESRRLYSKYGYSTIWEFVVKELGYDSGSAQRRINAMRISRHVPEVKEALASSALCLSTVSMIEQFTKNERKQGKKTYTADEKKALLDQVAHKSTRETEAILKALSPDACLPKERQRVVNAEFVEVSFLADCETVALLDEMKRLLSGGGANPSMADVVKRALEIAVAEKSKKMQARPDSLAKATKQSQSRPQAPPSSDHSRAGVTRPPRRKYISVHKRRAVYEEADNQCTFVSAITGKRCESRYQLEIEHIKPFAKNGSDNLENLTLLCKSHNLYNAVQQFNKAKSAAAVAGRQRIAAKHSM